MMTEVKELQGKTAELRERKKKKMSMQMLPDETRQVPVGSSGSFLHSYPNDKVCGFPGTLWK